MASLGSFAKRMQVYANNLERNVNKTVREVALVADRNLVLATPVDTGRARSNWLVSVGSPNRETQEPYSPGEAGSTGSANAQAAIAQANAEISRRKPGQDIFISNNLPYIGRLNEGSSAQAPEQFVGTAVQSAVDVVNKARVLRDGN